MVNQQKNVYMDNIHQYRQPVVTATGIFLGFLLNFTSSWIRDAFTKNIFRDMVAAISITVSLSLLLLVLIRILKIRYPTDTEKFYRKTLIFFFFGIVVPFLGFLVIIIDKMIQNVF
jgi:hypothetical protein